MTKKSLKLQSTMNSATLPDNMPFLPRHLWKTRPLYISSFCLEAQRKGDNCFTAFCAGEAIAHWETQVLSHANICPTFSQILTQKNDVDTLLVLFYFNIHFRGRRSPFKQKS